MTIRSVSRVISAMATSDGAGVRLHRSLGQRPDARLDPLLMLDEFVSDDPDDYLAGFPEHPHRGFETVTYMLEGHMLHQDHLGNRGHLKSGGAQWMTAGRGILHSEMPQQVAGRMHGFQLWINLPAREKMKAAGYRDVEPEEIPLARLGGGATARVLAGTINGEDGETSGPITGVATEPVFVDLFLPAGAEVTLAVKPGHNALAYVYDGQVTAGPADAARPLATRQAGLFGEGSALRFAADERAARLLVIAARPLGEPVVQYGPFVMNRREEIEQALADYRDGTLVR